MKGGETFQTAMNAEIISTGSNYFGKKKPSPICSASCGAPSEKTNMTGGQIGRSVERRLDCIVVWKMAATLLARSGKSGYGM